MQWRFGPYMLDLENACLWQGDQRLTVRPKTFDLLVYLVDHADALATKENLLDAVWPDTALGEGVLTTSMSELRKLLGETARDSQFIATVPRRGYRFIAPVTRNAPPIAPSATSATAPAAVPSLPSLVGREAELDQLDQLYTQALAGERQIVLITGEAGIGKTTLVDAFLARLANPDGPWISQGQCIHHYGEGEPYLPLLEAVSHLSKASGGTQVVDVLRQHGPSWLLQLPGLLPETATEVLQAQPFNTTRERMMRELAESVETLTAAHPLILVLEDLHWSDRSTLDWLDYIARRRAAARLLVLGTYRPIDAMVQDHPVRAVTQELRVHDLCHELGLDYLSEGGVAAYLSHRFGGVPFSSPFSRDLHQRTNGNPLFLVNVVNAMVQQGLIQRGASGGEGFKDVDVLTFEIPDTLRQFIEQQIRHLSPEDQELLEAASVAGVDFSAEAVAAALEIEPEAVETRSEALARNDQFIRSDGITTWPDGTVTAKSAFQHALYAEVLYDRAPLSRRVRWHHRMGLRLEAGYESQTREIAAELGEHFRRAQDAGRAAQYLYQAAKSASQRLAHREAIAHLRVALEQLTALPDTAERIQLELAVHLALAPALRVIQGAASTETEHAYNRARELCQQVGNRLQLLTVLEGLCSWHIVGGRYLKALELGKQLLPLAQSEQQPIHLLEAHRSLGTTFVFLGDLMSARAQLEAGIALHDPLQHRELVILHGMDLGAICRAVLATVLWRLGDADQSQQLMENALTLAQPHPYSLGFVLSHAVELNICRGELQLAQERLEKLFDLATTHGFPIWQLTGRLSQGSLLVEQGQWETGVTQLQQGIARQQAQGVGLSRSHWLARLAEGYRLGAQSRDGLHALDQAFDLVCQTGERFEEAELYRLQGELLLMEDEKRQQAADAEARFHLALEIARQQKARAWALRAAIGLGRLWKTQGRWAAAHTLLAEVYGGFTEGFDTADLKEAKTLLEQLSP